MSNLFKESAATPIHRPIMAKGVLRCPFCDPWRLNDSISARKKLGLHLVNDHDDEVLFPEGEEPPELRDPNKKQK